MKRILFNVLIYKLAFSHLASSPWAESITATGPMLSQRMT